MLELMIALLLVGACALPLSQFPMRAIQEEYKSAYRMQAQRLADLAFADFKEKLYKEGIPWKEISRARKDKTIVLNDVVEVSFEPLGKRKFLRLGTLHSVGKKAQNSDEWRLATFRVKITPQQKGFKLFRTKKSSVASRIFTYQVFISKTSAPATPTPSPETPPLPVPIPKE